MENLSLKAPATYQIHIQGTLDDSWGDYFGGRIVSTEDETVTILRTSPMDQPALVGLVNHLNGMGLRLLLVEQVDVEKCCPAVENNKKQ
jgi:hypothetical protein